MVETEDYNVYAEVREKDVRATVAGRARSLLVVSLEYRR